MPAQSASLGALAREVAASFDDHGQPLLPTAAPSPPPLMRVELVDAPVTNLVESALRHGRRRLRDPPAATRTRPGSKSPTSSAASPPTRWRR